MARSHLTPGVILILAGLLFLLYNVGVFSPRWDEIWPLALVAVGALLFLTTVGNRDKGVVFLATLLILVGMFFWLREEGMIRNDMDRLWPVFLIFVGIAFLARFLFQPDVHGPLPLGLIFLLIGVLLLLNSRDIVPWTVWETIWRAWPLILVILGLSMILRRRAQE